MNEGEPHVMWLSGLHIPESYLTALVQATCRKNGWPLDKSKHCLVKYPPKVLINELPILRVIPIEHID